MHSACIAYWCLAFRTKYAEFGPIHARWIDACNVFAFLGNNRISIHNVNIKLKRIKSIHKPDDVFKKGYRHNIGNRYSAWTLCFEIVKLRQGSARDGPQGERPQSLNPCLELTLKLVATTTHPPPPPPISLFFTFKSNHTINNNNKLFSLSLIP